MGRLFEGFRRRDVSLRLVSLFFFNDTATTEIYTLSLHDALPIYLEKDRYPKYLSYLKRIDVWVSGIDRSEERFSRNAETDIVCRLLLEKKHTTFVLGPRGVARRCRPVGVGDDSCTARTCLLFFNHTATPEIYPLSLHDALPI